MALVEARTRSLHVMVASMNGIPSLNNGYFINSLVERCYPYVEDVFVVKVVIVGISQQPFAR